MCQGQIAKISPQRIGVDVGDEHWLPAVRGGPARTHRWTDDQAVDCLGVVYWQAGRRAVSKLVRVRVEQKDRSQRTAGQVFDSRHRASRMTARESPLAIISRR